MFTGKSLEVALLSLAIFGKLFGVRPVTMKESSHLLLGRCSLKVPEECSCSVLCISREESFYF